MSTHTPLSTYSTISPYLTPAQLHHALTLRDLTDPAFGFHAVQLMLHEVLQALRPTVRSLRILRHPPVVAVRDNYDRLGYSTAAVTRAARYTQYVSPTTMLRSHMSAELPASLETYQRAHEIDELLAAPGLVYRRDAIDRTHVGQPHQLDVWNVRDTTLVSSSELLDVVGRVVSAVLPGAQWRTTAVVHPYTTGGLQVDVKHAGTWLELAECGLIHPRVLQGSGLSPQRWSGWALGLGLDRAVMLRKKMSDIRYLRRSDPRVAGQLLTLDPWREVSSLPAIRRDLSLVVSASEDDETLGDAVRQELGVEVDVLEAVEVLARTLHEDLPVQAQRRLRTRPGQANVLLRLVLRPLDRTLTAAQTNELRNRVYLAVHQGPALELT